MEPFTTENDKQLVAKLRNNEVQAFDSLFHKYSEKLYRFSFSLLKNEEDSKEVVQEVFFRIWNKRFDMDSTKSFKSLLFTISYNLIIDQLRLRLKDQNYRKFLRDYFDRQVLKTDSNIDFETLSQQVDTAVEELPGKRKQIYKLSRENGYSNKEIARELGISVKTVETQINLSLRHIKFRLGDQILPAILFTALFL